MPRYIVKLTDPTDQRDYYLEWSTIVDAPVTYGLSLDDFRRYYRDRYGVAGMERLPERLERVEAKGTSAMNDTLDGLLSVNHAGPDEARADLDGILERYCRNPGDDEPRSAELERASRQTVERAVNEMSAPQPERET